MQIKSILAGAALAAIGATTASAEIRIRHDPGGIIAEHIYEYARLRDAGEQVVVDGNCFSACTLVFGMLPPDRVCVTSRASLGFHAAWVPGADGRPIRSEEGTAEMWRLYPSQIRRWLTSKGGLTKRVLVLRGRELASMFRTCD